MDVATTKVRIQMLKEMSDEFCGIAEKRERHHANLSHASKMSPEGRRESEYIDTLFTIVGHLDDAVYALTILEKMGGDE